MMLFHLEDNIFRQSATPLDRDHGCRSCRECRACECSSLWVTVATGANYPHFGFVGPVLRDVIQDHLQFTEEIMDTARGVIRSVERQIRVNRVDLLDDHHFVGVHVR